MTTYRVTWEIDVEADSPEEAAREAFGMQRDDGTGTTTATVFLVSETFADGSFGEPVAVDVADESDDEAGTTCARCAKAIPLGAELWGVGDADDPDDPSYCSRECYDLGPCDPAPEARP